jgi:hypothetical protein
MILHNIMDTKLHVKLCNYKKLAMKIMSMTTMTMLCIEDALVDNTGVMCFCLLSVWNYKDKIIIGSRDTPVSISYKDGLVMKQIVGFYKNVIVLGVKSMYPNIIAKLGIFVDNIITYPIDFIRTRAELKESGLDIKPFSNDPCDTFTFTPTHSFLKVEDSVNGIGVMISDVIQTLITMR